MDTMDDFIMVGRRFHYVLSIILDESANQTAGNDLHDRIKIRITN